MLTFITFITAFALSGIAAYYSIFGLIALFSASTTAVAVMGSVIEVAKLVGVSYLYHKWKDTKLLLKTGLLTCIAIVMFITSMGVFGFLSKAHIEQTASIGNNDSRIERIDLSVDRYNRDIVRSENVLDQLEQALEKYVELGAVSKGLAKRSEQQPERESLNNTIRTAENEIDTLLSEKNDLQRETKLVELEVGPVRYIAAQIYNDPSKAQLEQAVRWVIIILVIVLDPFAILLLIAANQSLGRAKDTGNLQNESDRGIIEVSEVKENDDGLSIVERQHGTKQTFKTIEEREGETYV